MRTLLDLLFGFLIRRLRHGTVALLPSPVPVPVHRSRILRNVLLAFLVMFIAGRMPGWSCSMRPVTLWQMTEADLIAVARVEKLEPRAVSFTSLEGGTETLEETDVHLSILETWKGTSPDWIVVTWSGLQEGDLVLVMADSEETVVGSEVELSLEETETLSEEERHWLEVAEAEWRAYVRGRWQPRGELRRVTESDLLVLRERIREALDLQAQGPVSREAFRAWLIAMAERRVTRLDALEELMIGRFPSAWPIATDSWRASDVLTDEEMSRIRDGFIAEPAGDEDLIAIIGLFEGRVDATFDAAVASAVEGMLARKRVDDLTPVALRTAVMRVTGDERPVDVHVTPNLEQLRSVWTEVLDRWDIPRPPAAAVPEIEGEPE